MFHKKGVLKGVLCQSPFFNKVAGLRSATLFKKRLWQRCFPVNFVKFLRTPFLQNNSVRLPLSIEVNSNQLKYVPTMTITITWARLRTGTNMCSVSAVKTLEQPPRMLFIFFLDFEYCFWLQGMRLSILEYMTRCLRLIVSDRTEAKKVMWRGYIYWQETQMGYMFQASNAACHIVAMSHTHRLMKIKYEKLLSNYDDSN